MTQISLEEITEIRSLFSRSLQTPGIYLANHSLGRPLDEVQGSVTEYLDHWYNQLDDAWEPWMSKLSEFSSLVSEFLGIGRSDAVILKTSAGQGLRSVLNAIYVKNGRRPVKVVSTEAEFDSIHFILKSYEEFGLAVVTWVPASRSKQNVPIVDSADILAEINLGVDLVVLSKVAFTTGQIIDRLDEIIAKAHSSNAYVLVDTYHAFGVIEFRLGDVDFAIGGSYKYVTGGPGACWLAIHPSILDSKELATPDTGWFAKEDTFNYRRDVGRADGGQAWWESTPPIAVVYQAVPGLQFLKRVGVERLRHHSLEMQSRMREIFRSFGVNLFEPATATQFGAFSLLAHPNSQGLEARLRQKGVIVDARGEFVRFGPNILSTDQEFEDAGRVIQSCL